MLVLTRTTDQKIIIGGEITITILRVMGRFVKIGIQAPERFRVLRAELVERPLPGETPTRAAEHQPPPAARYAASQPPAAASGDPPAQTAGSTVRAPRDGIAPGEPLPRRAGPAICSPCHQGPSKMAAGLHAVSRSP